MSERHKTLMRTRCPGCNTVFRVTPEQLRVKQGKVRCGQCQFVFNAFDALITEDADKTLEAHLPDESFELANTPVEDSFAPVPESEPTPEPKPPPAPPPEPEAVSEPHAQIEIIDESTQAARQAGLVAARELSDTPAYNRWADGTLASNSLGAFNEPGRSAAWPYVIVVLLLSVALLAQLMLHFKTELVQRYPSMRGVFESLAVNLPLPRNSDLITIESSDLQSDNARGLLVLQATLHNRAPYDQAWPALELTLTDTQDVVLSRRVLAVDNYLPSISKQPAFPANVEFPIRLWIEAKELGAAGYRLYVFYP